MATKKRKKKNKETKGERAIKVKRELDFALEYGAFGYPYTAQAMREA